MSTGQQPANKNLAYYSDCFSQMKVYKNQKRGGEALNQPVLLLSVIDLITQGLIQTNFIPISEELINAFKKYWRLLTSDPFENSDFALPFFHLKNRKPKFWHLKFSEQYDGGRPQTINTLKEAVDHAKLDDELFYLLKDTDARRELIDALITAWFSSSQKQLEDILNINQSLQDYISEESETLESANATQQPKIYLKKSFVREAFFRKTIVHLYDYRCAFCRLKVTRTLKQSIVDGAHIKPFSEFYDSQVNNGLSLCKNHHWAFDKGWFTIDNEYKIIIASDLQEESPHNRSMREFHGEFILLPISEQYFPRIEAIQWHRKNVFKA
ncbi:MAG: HNH endonuclease [Actinomycetota bacterium]